MNKVLETEGDIDNDSDPEGEVNVDPESESENEEGQDVEEEGRAGGWSDAHNQETRDERFPRRD